MTDVIVVGGGIVGTSCALELTRQGLKVTVVESGAIGGGSSAAGMGHVVVMDDSDAQFALTSYSQKIWQEHYEIMPKRCEVTHTGTLWVAADEEEFSHVESKHQFYSARGLKSEILDAKLLRQAEPNLKHDLAGALRVIDDSVIYPMTAAQWMLDEAIAKGAKLVQSKVVAMNGKSVTLQDGTRLEANNVVNAAGGHAAELTPSLNIQPRKGHLIITDRYPGFVNHQLVELGYLKSAHTMSKESVAFNLQPRATGQLLLGSSRQLVGWDSSIDRSIVKKMVDRALMYMPGIANLSAIRVWTGFRATTPDKLPLIGPLPEQEGLYICAGHEGLGITTATASGRLIADMIAGKPSQIDPTPYLPSRPVKDHD